MDPIYKRMLLAIAERHPTKQNHSTTVFYERLPNMLDQQDGNLRELNGFGSEMQICSLRAEPSPRPRPYLCLLSAVIDILLGLPQLTSFKHQLLQQLSRFWTRWAAWRRLGIKQARAHGLDTHWPAQTHPRRRCRPPPPSKTTVNGRERLEQLQTMRRILKSNNTLLSGSAGDLFRTIRKLESSPRTSSRPWPLPFLSLLTQ
ncbi:hypothetical protein PtA15_14A264 [Puccinia triticina]|uniref:Uncharacterized protein n=1 Tax=Puccinia triticina TaxID=208348 RepID=A0ABY7D1U4_9BASI|nr:uncharacterized protein PtA15_14A264 [Puccinia triticina]WAQ91381.1 hypothetical protein PtA15_14A264 [Puccinia triticina]